MASRTKGTHSIRSRIRRTLQRLSVAQSVEYLPTHSMHDIGVQSLAPHKTRRECNPGTWEVGEVILDHVAI